MTASTPLLNLMRAEYAATPGLKLTIEQACRLWQIDEAPCRLALSMLVAEGVLHETGSGAYVALPPAASAPLKAPLTQEFRVRCPHCRKLNTLELEPTIHGHATTHLFRCVACQQIISTAAIPA